MKSVYLEKHKYLNPFKMFNISQISSEVMEALKEAGYDPNFHRLQSDGEGNFWW